VIKLGSQNASERGDNVTWTIVVTNTGLDTAIDGADLTIRWRGRTLDVGDEQRAGNPRETAGAASTIASARVPVNQLTPPASVFCVRSPSSGVPTKCAVFTSRSPAESRVRESTLCTGTAPLFSR